MMEVMSSVQSTCMPLEYIDGIVAVDVHFCIVVLFYVEWGWGRGEKEKGSELHDVQQRRDDTIIYWHSWKFVMF